MPTGGLELLASAFVQCAVPATCVFVIIVRAHRGTNDQLSPRRLRRARPHGNKLRTVPAEPPRVAAQSGHGRKLQLTVFQTPCTRKDRVRRKVEAIELAVRAEMIGNYVLLGEIEIAAEHYSPVAVSRGGQLLLQHVLRPAGRV